MNEERKRKIERKKKEEKERSVQQAYSLVHHTAIFPPFFSHRVLNPTSDWLVTIFGITLIGLISTHLYSTYRSTDLLMCRSPTLGERGAWGEVLLK